MARPRSVSPTRRELAILRVLWSRGPSSGRAILEALAVRPRPAYTSLLTNLQAMLGKGLVARDESRRPHVYSAEVSRDEVEGQVVGDVIDRLFDGSASRLVAAALAGRRASEGELRRIEEMVEALKREGGES